MWLKTIHLSNIKGFSDSGVIEFSKGINILVGPNNSGKSTILRSIQVLQPMMNDHRPNFFAQNSLRTAANKASITLELEEPDLRQLRTPKNWDNTDWKPKINLLRNANGFDVTILAPNNNFQAVQQPLFNPSEPDNFIYPYFSGRKPLNLQHQVNATHSNTIEESFQHLPSKIDRLSGVDYPPFAYFRDACKKILNLNISSAMSGDGKLPGLALQNGQFLHVQTMGEGTGQVLFFLAHLCAAKGNLFLIEEIENDIHPKALKSLLGLIIEKSTTNQFIVSTHNNIVVRHLGGAPKSRVFSLDMKQEPPDMVPTCTCQLVPEQPDARIALLENLGYDIFDAYLWKGYLLLEESTAERVIRDFLIPQFYPTLVTRLKTIAAAGIDDVEPRMIDFLRLFVFIHTSPAYKERAWVAVDGDEKGTKTIADLKLKFGKDWPESHFRCFSAEDFESYYPPQFKQKTSEALAMQHGLPKQKAKGNLAVEVVTWALANKDEAKDAFAKSAKDVLDLLAEIERKLH